MEINNATIKDGDATQPLILLEAPSIIKVPNHKVEGNARKKRRRGKSKRNIVKPFIKIPWQDRRNYDNVKRKNRFRNIVLSKTQAPFNNNQFLMEIHKPEAESGNHTFRTPSARTRDSSFSVDSEENYFFSLPEDEEEYLTKEFSSVYEDAQSERLSDMSKNDLIQEYLILEAKYESLVRRNKIKTKENDENKDTSDNERDVSFTDRDSTSTEKDNSDASLMCCSINDPSNHDIMIRLKEQEEQIHELQITNEKLLSENNKLRQRAQRSSEDSESDSSSSSNSCSSSSCSMSPEQTSATVNGDITLNEVVQVNGVHHDSDSPEPMPLVNGFHSPKD